MDERVIRMVNPVRQGSVMHFYEGQLTVDDKGVVLVPADKRHWVLRLWRLGFNKTLDGKLCCTHPDIHIAHELATVEELPQVSVTPVDETETAESGEETNDEGADAGRQPAGDDGVRTSEPARDVSLPAEGDDGSDGDEPADGGEGD